MSYKFIKVIKFVHTIQKGGKKLYEGKKTD